MCLSRPGTVRELKLPMALVDIGGSARWYNALMHPDLKLGDRVLVHASLVVKVVQPEEAAELESLMAEMDELGKEASNAT